MDRKVCSCCRSLAAAIGKYIAKAEDDLAKELDRMGYAESSDSVKRAGQLEDELAETLTEQTNRIVEFFKKFVSLEAAMELLAAFFDADAARSAIQEIFENYYEKNVPKLANVYIKETDGSMAVSRIRKRTTAWITEWSAALSDMMNLTSEQQIESLLKEAVQNGEGVDAFTRRLMNSGIRNEEWRARRAAITEMLRAHSVAQHEAMMQDASVVWKKWVHTGNYRMEPRKNHLKMHGQTVLKEKPYKLHGIKGGIYYPMYPRDTVLPPEESVSCHCLSQPVVDEDILGMPLEERQKLQQQIIEEDDGKWMKELDAQNKAKAGINEDTVKLDWLKAKDREEQIKYFGGGEAGKQRLALVESGVISTDKELEQLYKVNGKGKRVRKSLQELADDGIFTVSSDTLRHSTVGDFTSTNRLAKGGHSQESMDVMDEKGITYHVTKTYSNGVRIGFVDNHKQPTKSGNTTKRPDSDIGQSWFPEDWTGDDVRNAGTYVANKGMGTSSTKFAVYKGVKVGVYVDADGSPTTIFPNNKEQPKVDGTMEGARD